MKIAVIIDNDLNNDKRVLRELSILVADGHAVSVLCFGFRGSNREPLPGISIERIMIRKKLKDWLFFLQNLLPFYERLWVKRIARHISAFKPGVVHVHDLYMAKAGREGIRRSGERIPMVLDLHENYPYAVLAYNWTKGFIRGRLSQPGLWKKKEPEYLGYADGIVVLSKEFRETLTAEYPQLSGVPFAVFPNVPDLEEKKAGEPVDLKVMYDEHTAVMLYFGVVAERRGIFDTLDVLRSLAEEKAPVRFLIIGPVDRSDKTRFFSEINSAALKDTVLYLPWIEARELPAYLGISDFCIAPFHKNPHHESGVANKIFDYMLGEKPLIVSDCKPQKNLVEKYRCGIVYRNADELRSAIIRLSNDRKLREEMGKNGRAAILNEYNTGFYRHVLTGLYLSLSPHPGKSENTHP
jgi:glycosyltransferase involved in cell wall biosynthesis